MGDDAEAVGLWLEDTYQVSGRLWRRGRPKKIVEYTAEELDEAVAIAVERVPRFWVLLRGVDAYMERRRRKSRDNMVRAALDEEIVI